MFIGVARNRPANLPESLINDRDCEWVEQDAEIARTERGLHEGQLFFREGEIGDSTTRICSH